jgi:serine/threonine protein kinase
MPLSPGTRLGAYEIVAKIGEGGMGEVWRATDTRLKRQVALKVLSAAFMADPERIARFQREAEVLAALNHTNIAQIYGLEETDGVTALVLELVEGPTLADRISRGPIPIEEALPIARQIAEALEAAHEQRIIHRDLKPANIKVRDDGTVKVLDFGLAKLAESVVPSAAPPVPLTQSPTITSPAMMTGVGVLLGTAAYMSPEQAKGKPADRRSDIWAFGCVLYEMLSGKRAFEGEDVSDTLAAILRGEPNWRALPAATPSSVRRLLNRALQKDQQLRLPHIGTARLDIDEARGGATSDDGREFASSGSVNDRQWWRIVPWLVALSAGVIAIAALAVASFAGRRDTTSASLIRISAELGVDAAFFNFGTPGAPAVLSPDGHILAFVAQKTSPPTQLFIRRLDQLEATALSGTEFASNPFFSPDGQWVGFMAQNSLKKVSVNGGASVTLMSFSGNRRQGVDFDGWRSDANMVANETRVVLHDA